MFQIRTHHACVAAERRLAISGTNGARRAAELTGKWSGSFDITKASGETQADTAYVDLKETGGQVTGTAGPGVEKQWPLRKGKLDGQKLAFEVPTDDGGLLVFDLTFDGTAIQGMRWHRKWWREDVREAELETDNLSRGCELTKSGSARVTLSRDQRPNAA